MNKYLLFIFHMAERILEEDVVGRPAKKARLEPPITDLPDTPIDDMDDTSIYGTPSIVPSPRAAQGGEVANTGNSAEGCSEPASLEGLNNGIPGLGLLGSPTQEIYYQAPTPESDRHDTNLELTNQGEERVDAGVALPKHSSLDLDSENQVNEGAIDVEESIGNEDSVGTPDLIKLSDGQTKISTSILDFTKESSDKALIAIPDPEFLRAAEVNRDNENAEWQFDSSDAKTPSSANTSDTSGSSDSSEADSEDEDDYPLLDPDEQAKILMQGDDGSDGEGGNRKGKGGTGMQLRTRNEIEDVKVAKPDVSITSEMKIEELGEIDKIIDNLVLVKAKVSGEYQVLDSGSILCFEDRRVMGVVGDTLGRVQQPLYSVAFNSATEIAEEGVTIGTKVFYVEQHSSYVFTQPLKAMKGSDASNLHDEEVGEDELEFSDDEAEADYRRRVKLEKQSMRDAKNLGNGFSGQQKPKGGRRESSKYRDMGKAQVDLIKDTDGDDLYTPLARPTNLHELIGKGGATQEAQKFRSPTERSTSGGRGKDRDRAGRGNRCERGGRRGDRQGSAKGTHDYRPPMERFGGQDPSPSTLQFAGNANTFNSGPQSPSTGISYFPPQQPTQYSPHNTPSQFQQPFPVIYEHQPNYSWTQPPIPPQHLFAHFTTSQGYYPQSPGNAIPSPGGTLPPGSFVNPAFFRNQQQSPWVHHQQPTTPSHQQPQSGATRMSPEAEAAFKAAQERLDILKELSGVSGASGRDQAG